jgi:LemA protein
MYNLLIAKKNDVAKAFSSIDVMLKRRHDLIPNLIEVVKSYMSYEKGLLTEVTEIRTKVLANSGLGEQRIQMENSLTQKLGSILVAAENYPDLKASSGFVHLQTSWNEAEEQIAASRRAYNATVTEYNNTVEMFPSNLMASLLGYKCMSLLEVNQADKVTIGAKEMFNE